MVGALGPWVASTGSLASLRSRQHAPTMTNTGMALALALLCLKSPLSIAQPTPAPQPARHGTLLSYKGSTPTLDGVLSPGEYDDAFSFSAPWSGGQMAWTAEFLPVTDPLDLGLSGWIKHDDTHLYLAFNITDDVLYAVQTDRWTPKANPQANILNQTGWPWFGDEMEVLLNAAAGPPAQCPSSPRGVVGNETEWQMVMNLQKSRLGGLGVGGLMEGEPRSNLTAWNNYQSWIKQKKMEGAAKISVQAPGHNVWVAEWKIGFELMQIAPGRPYSSDMPDTTMGLNVALGDVDTQAVGNADYGIRHEVRTPRSPWSHELLYETLSLSRTCAGGHHPLASLCHTTNGSDRCHCCDRCGRVVTQLAEPTSVNSARLS